VSDAPPLVYTPGEPAGIGPDLILDLAARGLLPPLVVLADPSLLARRAEILGLAVELRDARRTDATGQPGQLAVADVPLAVCTPPGEPARGNAPSLLRALDEAVSGCLQRRYRAMVTGPLNKASINDDGIPFSGHTEYIAARCGTGCPPVMMLAGGGLRVALVTTHLPLSRVSEAITPAALEQVIRVLHRDLCQRFHLVGPRIMVLGLNPHCGEGGHLGREEIDVVEPVLVALRGEGMDLIGPVPADTAFHPTHLSGCDAVLAMYHDQGLPVLKHASFGEAVNITLGLPIVRTSVDHGTAYDLAGTGRADSGSLRQALDVALAMTPM
jgi:4-hydroxythreonine-4-phosphate dehydrogenase